MENLSKRIKVELLNNGVKTIRCKMISGRYFITCLPEYADKCESILNSLGLEHSLMNGKVYRDNTGNSVDFPNMVFKRDYKMGAFIVKDNFLGYSLIGIKGDWRCSSRSKQELLSKV